MSPIRGTGDTLQAYRSTTIPVHESQADIRELLRGRKATGMQISESWVGDHAVADVRFGMPGEAGFYAYRIRVQVVVTDKDLERQPHQRTPTAKEVEAQKERQIWRLVFWWLKAQFEAADAGLVSLEEAFMPWMELPDGSTAYEAMAKSGGLARIATGNVPQLTAGKS